MLDDHKVTMGYVRTMYIVEIVMDHPNVPMPFRHQVTVLWMFLWRGCCNEDGGNDMDDVFRYLAVGLLLEGLVS